MKTEITNQDTIENERAKLAKFIEVRLREREEKNENKLWDIFSANHGI